MRLMIITALLVGAAGVAAPAVAGADPYGYDYDNPPPAKGWNKLSLEGAFGIYAGSQPIGYVSSSIAAPHLDLGARLDRWLVFATGAMGSVGESETEGSDLRPVRGVMARAGVGVRYTYGRLGGGGGELPLRGQFWVELGAGHKHIRWNEGGVLGRQDLVIGLGAQLDIRVNREKQKYLGLYYAFDILFSGAPAMKERPPVCAGPCDEATGPGSMDVGFLLNVGIPFGK